MASSVRQQSIMVALVIVKVTRWFVLKKYLIKTNKTEHQTTAGDYSSSFEDM
jgi:hypothetical protein